MVFRTEQDVLEYISQSRCPVFTDAPGVIQGVVSSYSYSASPRCLLPGGRSVSFVEDLAHVLRT